MYIYFLHDILSNNNINLAKLVGFCVTEQWGKHVPEKALDNLGWKILWDFRIQTGSPLSHNGPDISYLNKSKAETKFIDIAIPGDSRVSQKSVEKRDRYSVIVSRLWNTSTSVVPVIIDALGSIPTDLHQNLTSIGLTSSAILSYNAEVCSPQHLRQLIVFLLVFFVF